MKLHHATLAMLAFGLVAPGAQAAPAMETIEAAGSSGGGGELPPILQCVPYARQVSGIEIYGDAHTWWDQAAGRYARGSAPRVGAVMAFRPHGNMILGHVAAVSRVIDARTVLLRHANWSEINGRRGQIEDNVRAIDVSPANDWSEVRVWYAPSQALGTTHWPVEGFIYGSAISRDRRSPALARPAPPPTVKPVRLALAEAPKKAARGESVPAKKVAALTDDPIGELIAASRKRR